MNKKIGGIALGVLTIANVIVLAALLVVWWQDARVASGEMVPTEPWAESLVARVTQLEQQNALLIEKVETAQSELREVKEVAVEAEGQIVLTRERMGGLERSVSETGDQVVKMGARLALAQEAEEAELELADEEEPALEDFIRIELDPINGLAGPHVIIEGANVHVRSGGGATDDLGRGMLGLGNLVVGYNEDDPNQFKSRNGSHNLVVGNGHGYSSFGGLVAGFANEVAAPSASVTGGTGNEASGWYSSVSGGQENRATGNLTSVTGGEGNQAEGDAASVTGGNGNLASGLQSTVTGGSQNRAIGVASAISGGQGNRTEPTYSALLGGLGRAMTEDMRQGAVGMGTQRDDITP